MTNSLNLNFIAARLEGLEETIIYKLMDRAQFKTNKQIYQPNKNDFHNFPNKSLFDIRLLFQEEMDAKFGRFCVPEERPFFKNLPKPHRKVTLPNSNLHIKNFDIISQNEEIKNSYLEMVSQLCSDGDDGQYGSSVEHDVYVLQSIARRVHYGSLYVAESKFIENTEKYTKLINNKDVMGITELLTRKEVEDKILLRINDKVNKLQSNLNTKVRNTINPEIIVSYYKNWIIPLTKKGEIAYLLQRTSHGY